MLAFFVGTNVTHFCCSWLLATVLLLNGEKNEQKHLLIFIISSWQQGRGARRRTSPHLTENARPSFGSSASAPSAPLPLGQKHPHSLAHTHMRTKTQCLLTHNSIGVPSLTLPGECKWPCPPPPPRRRWRLPAPTLHPIHKELIWSVSRVPSGSCWEDSVRRQAARLLRQLLHKMTASTASATQTPVRSTVQTTLNVTGESESVESIPWK